MSQSREQVFNIAFTGLLIGIILLMGFVPFLGFIPLGFASVTIIHIPVIVAILFLDWKYATITGISFGIISWIIAIIRPQGILDPLFQYPHISVLPRFLFTIISVTIYKGIKPRFYRSERSTYITDVIFSFLATMIHSIITLGFLVIFFYGKVSDLLEMDAGRFFILTLTSFSLLEAAASALIAPPIVRALRKIKRS